MFLVASRKCYVVTGETKQSDELIQMFRDDELPAVLLITTTKGGVGLNLIEASCVYFMETSWNPYVCF